MLLLKLAWPVRRAFEMRILPLCCARVVPVRPLAPLRSLRLLAGRSPLWDRLMVTTRRGRPPLVVLRLARQVRLTIRGTLTGRRNPLASRRPLHLRFGVDRRLLYRSRVTCRPLFC